MINKLLFTAMFFMLALNIFSQVPSYVPTNGLVGYWPFNGNANDESLNGNNGTVNGATLTTDRNGNVNRAYSFNGVSDFINVPSNTGLNLIGNFTLSAWVKLANSSISNSSYEHHFILSKNGGITGQGTWHMALESQTNQPFQIHYNADPCFCSNTMGGANSQINDINWHLINISYNSTNQELKYFLDGNLVYTSTQFNYTNQITTYDLLIGKENIGLPGFFNGKIDDIGIWNRALTQQEITNLYNSQMLPTCSITASNNTICAGDSTTLTISSSTNLSPCSSTTLSTNLQNGLIGYWPFCGNANDESGNGNHGTINGATLTTDRFGNTNSAFEFNGVNCCGTADPPSEIEISNQILNLGSNYTITCWMKSNNVQKYQQCLFNSINHTGFAVELNNEHVPNRLTFGVGPSNAFWDLLYAPGSNTSYQNNQWYFVAFVKSGTTYSMYLNGVLDYSTSLPNSINYNQWVALRIGSIGGGNQNFEGSLDDYAAWNRALSGSELNELYNVSNNVISTSYLWSNGTTTPSITISPTTTTTYSCTVTNNGVSCTDDVTINVDQLAFSLPATTSACGTSATLSAGSGASSYLWNSGATSSSIDVSSSGSYSCTAVNGACTLTDTTVLTLVNATISASDSVICAGESVTIGHTSSFQINSNCISNTGSPNPWPFPSPTDGGYINLGNFGAQNIFSISMWVNPGTIQNGISILLDASHGGSSNWVVQAFGNNTYTWGDLSFNLTPNSWQHLLLTYENGIKKCFINGQIVSTVNQTISYAGSPNLYLGNWPEGGRRFNGLVDELYITNNILYQSNFTPLETIALANSSVFGLWHFDEGNGPNTTASNTNQIHPIGGWNWSVRQTEGLPATFSWSNGATTPSITVTPSTTMTYSCTINSNGISCIDDVTVVVDTPPTPTITPSGSTSICSGGSLTLTSSSATGNLWATGETAQSIVVSTAGNYGVTVTNTSGCSALSLNTTVNVNALPIINAGNDQTVCAGTSVTLSGTGADTYSWDNGVIDGVLFTPSANITYTVTGTNTSTGCTNTDQVDVTVNALPIVNAGIDQTVCAGGNIILNGSGADNYSWDNSVSNGIGFTPATNTTFIVTGTNTATGCTNTDQIVVTVNALPIVNAGIDQTVCAGGNIILNGSGADNYSWDNSVIDGVLFTPSADATYIVTGTNTATGCTNTDQVDVTVNALPTINAGIDQTVCAGTTVTLSGTGADTYSWDNSVNNGIGFIPSANSTYTVTGINTSTGCTNTDQVDVTVNALPTINAGIDQTVCNGDNVVLNGSGAATYSWDNAVIDGISFVPTATEIYHLQGTDLNGCQGIDSVQVIVNNTSTSTLTETALDSYTLNGQTYTQSGTYSQVIPNAAGCDSTITLNLTLNFTGIAEMNDFTVSIYPNPSRDILFIHSEIELFSSFELIDNHGRIVLNDKLKGNQTSIYLEAIAPGNYYLKIEERNILVKVVKQ